MWGSTPRRPGLIRIQAILVSRALLATAVLFAALNHGCYLVASPTDASVYDADVAVAEGDAAGIRDGGGEPDDGAVSLSDASASVDGGSDGGTGLGGFPPAAFPWEKCVATEDARTAQIAVSIDGIFVRIEHTTRTRVRDLLHLESSGWKSISDSDGNPPVSLSSVRGGLVESAAGVFERQTDIGCGLRRIVSDSDTQCVAWAYNVPAADLRSPGFEYAISDSSVFELQDGIGAEVYRARGSATGPHRPFTSVASAIGGVWLGTSSGLWELELPGGDATLIGSAWAAITQLASNENHTEFAYVVEGTHLLLAGVDSSDYQPQSPLSRCERSLQYEEIVTLRMNGPDAIVQSSNAIWRASRASTSMLYEVPCNNSTSIVGMSGVYKGRLWFLRTPTDGSCAGYEMASIPFR